MEGAGLQGALLHWILLARKTNTVAGRPKLLLAEATVATTSANSLDESNKVYVIFCEALQCDYFGHGLQNCYCCPDGHSKENCHLTMEDCRATCAVCNPRCPTQPSLQ
ncbi:hypothetical protein SETIT_3G252700v2 [Setaria italica]|uniref:Embryo surrounding factor 1 brassicaceae domain-containing protein n=1 Tax=Setaria italica TaxID=4555 RepID=A0A368QJE1_SETIT|nr:hypothetical protein SETIT_3G252700v2 [Setaria italica]